MGNSLAAVHPELVAEWSDRNLPLTPDRAIRCGNDSGESVYNSRGLLVF